MVSDKLLNYAAENYCFDINTLIFIKGSLNIVYKFKKDNKNYILRFSKRPSEYIHQKKAEMDWLHYLAINNVSVSLPLKAKYEDLAISITDDNVNYIISAYEMATGKYSNENDQSLWNEKLFYNWGKLMGEMHSLTKEYQPLNNNVRNSFTGRDYLHDTVRACPTVNKIAETLVEDIMNLPKSKDSYGLIHCDIHPNNFLVDDMKIHLFDFDECLYGWFALDIGISLHSAFYHSLFFRKKDDFQKNLNNIIIKNFLKGYFLNNQSIK